MLRTPEIFGRRVEAMNYINLLVLMKPKWKDLYFMRSIGVEDGWVVGRDYAMIDFGTDSGNADIAVHTAGI